MSGAECAAGVQHEVGGAPDGPQRQVSCDWWRAGHVTTVRTSDWSSHDSADWSRGEINVTPDIIKHFWVPDIVIHDLVRYYLK